MKIGSEKQGGVPNPSTINQIAAQLIRNKTSGQLNGTVVLRGFIYGSDFHYSKKSRIAIPAAFFGPFDGQYASNVHIAGKYSPLDFETVEPLNPLDGLLKKTKYGGEVVVGKPFFMSWLNAWQAWLNFDNHRGPNGASQRNRATIESFVGVAMMSGSAVPWTDNPLNMINFYGYGRMAWDPTVTPTQVYTEWIARTFGTGFPDAAVANLTEMLLVSEQAATDLALYHGYRGIWYEFEPDGSFRSPNSVHQIIDSHSVGTASDLAKEVLDEYSAGTKAYYTNYSNPGSEAVVLEWGQFDWDYKLHYSGGRTLFQDSALRPVDGLASALKIYNIWTDVGMEAAVRGAVGDAYFNTAAAQLAEFVATAQQQVNQIHRALSKFRPLPPLPPSPPPPPPPQPSPPPPPPPGPSCTITVTKQISKHHKCEPQKTYGCGANKTMWVSFFFLMAVLPSSRVMASLTLIANQEGNDELLAHALDERQ